MKNLATVTATRTARIAAIYSRLSASIAKRQTAPTANVQNARLSRADVSALLN